MAEFAKVSLAAAPGCPNCKNRLSDLPLDELSPGDEYQCVFCGERIRIPKQVLDRLRAQRDALRAEHEQQKSVLTRIRNFFRRLFGA